MDIDEHYFLENDRYYVNCDTDRQYPTCPSCFELKKDLTGAFSRDCVEDCVHYKKKVVKDTTYKGWTFLTIAPSKLRTGGLKMKDEKLLEQFCHRWFAKYNFSEYFWVIEYGKDEDDEFLHIHALFKGIVNKKFKKEGQYKFLVEEWNKLLPAKIDKNYVKSWMEKKANPSIDADVLHQKINDKSLWEMKYNYLHNDLKGTHANFAEGTLGVISSN